MHPSIPLNAPQETKVAGVRVRAQRIDTGHIAVQVRCDCKQRQHWHDLTTVTSAEQIGETVRALIT